MNRLGRQLLRPAIEAAYRRGNRARLPVLMYHRVLPKADPLQPGLIDATQANQQFKVLSELFNVLHVHEAVDLLKQGRLPPRAIAITFDDGYRDNHDVALPLLQRHGICATFYIASGFIDGGRMFHDSVIEAVRRLPTGRLELQALGLPAFTIDDDESRRAAIRDIVQAIKYMDLAQRQAVCDQLERATGGNLPRDLMMTSEQVAEMARRGMSIGGHTVQHPILQRVDEAAARNEIATNRSTLAAILGEAPRTFAYPNGKPRRDYTCGHVQMLRDVGYEAAVSTAVGVSDQGADVFQLPRFVITESTYSTILFRLLRMSSVLTNDYSC